MIRRLLLSLVALQLAGCSIFESDDPRKPTELTPITQELKVRQIWSSSIGSSERVYLSPAFSNGDVFVAAADGSLARLAGATGAQVWRIKLDSGISAGVGADAQSIAVVDNAGELFVLDQQGVIRWHAPTGGEVLGAPGVFGNSVLARTTDGRILAYDATTGARRWLYSRVAQPLVIRGNPGLVSSGGNVLAGLSGGKFIALSLNNGGLRWETAVAVPKGATELERVSDVMGTPVIGPRDVCVATFQGRVGCFYLDNGQPIWTRDVSTPTGVAIDVSYAYVSNEDSVVQAYSRVSGSSIWKDDKLLYRQLTAPAIYPGAVAFGDIGGFVHWMAREDGKLVARASTDDSPIRVTPLAIEIAGKPALVVQTQHGGVYVFGPE